MFIRYTPCHRIWANICILRTSLYNLDSIIRLIHFSQFDDLDGVYLFTTNVVVQVENLHLYTWQVASTSPLFRIISDWFLSPILALNAHINNRKIHWFLTGIRIDYLRIERRSTSYSAQTGLNIWATFHYSSLPIPWFSSNFRKPVITSAYSGWQKPFIVH